MPRRQPRFVAELPWIGPHLGHRDSGDTYVSIAGAVNPVFGVAFAAGLIPVVREQYRRSVFVPADKNGHPSSLENVAAVVQIQSDSYGWFTVHAKSSWWKRVEGVLVVLLYDAAPELARNSFSDYPNAFVGSTVNGIARTAVGLNKSKVSSPVRGSHHVACVRPTRMSKPISDALEALLTKTPADELEIGLVQIPSHETLQPAKHGGSSRSSGARFSFPVISFAVASCQYPPGMLDYELAEASYRRLASRLDASAVGEKPEFLLLTGDQIYVDATAGMFDSPNQFERFVRPYNTFFHMRAVRNVLRRLPAYMMLDDHENEDNWEPLAWTSRIDPGLDIVRKLYLRFQRAGGPPIEQPVGDSREPLWYTFEKNGFPFFVADSRTERTPRTAALADRARIMSDAQFDRLLRWLSEHDNDVPKFIATPAMLLPRRLRTTQHGHPASALRSDAWDGYPYSLHRLLAFIADRRIENVVFLSGDEHLSCIAEASITATGRNSSVSILSIHASALYAPFPFANSVPADFAARETFFFELDEEDGGAGGAWLRGKYACEVDTEFAPEGDGFAIIHVSRERDGWKVRCEYDRGDGDTGSSRVIDRMLSTNVRLIHDME